MKEQNYKKFSDLELEDKLKEFKLELYKAHTITKRLGFTPKLGSNPKKVNRIKKEIARIKTEINSRK